LFAFFGASGDFLYFCLTIISLINNTNFNLIEVSI